MADAQFGHLALASFVLAVAYTVALLLGRLVRPNRPTHSDPALPSVVGPIAEVRESPARRSGPSTWEARGQMVFALTALAGSAYALSLKTPADSSPAPSEGAYAILSLAMALAGLAVLGLLARAIPLRCKANHKSPLLRSRPADPSLVSPDA